MDGYNLNQRSEKKSRLWGGRLEKQNLDEYPISGEPGARAVITNIKNTKRFMVHKQDNFLFAEP